LRLLDHAVGGQNGVGVCEKFVEAAGLKTIFGMLMRKPDAQTTEHVLGIVAALLRSLPATSAARIRVLAKFVEKEYEKIEKLLKLRRDYAEKVRVVDEDIRREKRSLQVEEQEDMAGEWLSRRLDAGLFCLQVRPSIRFYSIQCLLGPSDDRCDTGMAHR
jgi:beta-catenin-like protein 1